MNLPLRSPSDLLRELEALFERGGSDDLQSLFTELDVSLHLAGTLSEQDFEQLLRRLTSLGFWKAEESWRLLNVLQSSWELLSTAQREALFPILGEHFDSHRDFMGAFVIAEILGEHFCDERALELLIEKAQTASMPSRALVPHGLEWLAAHTEDPKLRERALEIIQELAADGDADVMCEAQESLGRLRRNGGLQ